MRSFAQTSCCHGRHAFASPAAPSPAPAPLRFLSNAPASELSCLDLPCSDLGRSSSGKSAGPRFVSTAAVSDERFTRGPSRAPAAGQPQGSRRKAAAQQRSKVSRKGPQRGKPSLKPFSAGPLSSPSDANLADINNYDGAPSDLDDFEAPETFSVRSPTLSAEEELLLIENGDLSDTNEQPMLPTSIADLETLREDLKATDSHARSAAQALESMAILSRSLPDQQLTLIHGDPLMKEVIKIMDTNMHGFTPRLLASLLVSLAHLNYVPGTVLTKIMRAVEAQIDDFSTGNLVNVYWAMAKLEVHPGPSLERAIADRLILGVVDLTPKYMAISIWASARLNNSRPELLDALAQEITARLTATSSHFDPHTVCNIAWAFGKLQYRAPPALTDAIEKHAHSHFRDYSAQAISMTLWGLARVGCRPATLLSLVKLEMEACALQFTANDLAALMTAFMMLEYHDKRVIQAAMQLCLEQRAELQAKPQILCSILFSVATLDVRGARAFGHQVLPLIEKRIWSLTPRALANLVTAIAKLRITVAKPLGTKLASRCITYVPHMDGLHISAILKEAHNLPSFANSPTLLCQLKRYTMVLIRKNEMTVDQVLHSMKGLIRAGRFTKAFGLGTIAHVTAVMQAGKCTEIDVAEFATIIGQWRGGPLRGDARTPIVDDAIHTVEAQALRYITAGKFSPRQTTDVVWMLGRCQRQPSQTIFVKEVSKLIIKDIDKFNHIDVSNLMYGFISMGAPPGLLALDAIAHHLNMRYTSYGQHEMAQVLYSFAMFKFHPGAVVGRAKVVFQRQPDLFSANSRRMLGHALQVFEGQDRSSAILGSRDIDPISDEHIDAVLMAELNLSPKRKQDIWDLIHSES